MTSGSGKARMSKRGDGVGPRGVSGRPTAPNVCWIVFKISYAEIASVNDYTDAPLVPGLACLQQFFICKEIHCCYPLPKNHTSSSYLFTDLEQARTPVVHMDGIGDVWDWFLSFLVLPHLWASAFFSTYMREKLTVYCILFFCTGGIIAQARLTKPDGGLFNSSAHDAENVYNIRTMMPRWTNARKSCLYKTTDSFTSHAASAQSESSIPSRAPTSQSPKPKPTTKSRQRIARRQSTSVYHTDSTKTRVPVFATRLLARMDDIYAAIHGKNKFSPVNHGYIWKRSISLRYIWDISFSRSFLLKPARPTGLQGRNFFRAQRTLPMKPFLPSHHDKAFWSQCCLIHLLHVLLGSATTLSFLFFFTRLLASWQTPQYTVGTKGPALVAQCGASLWPPILHHIGVRNGKN